MGEKKPPAGGHRHGGNANEHAALNRPVGRGATGCQYGHEQLLDALRHIPADLSRDDWWRILAASKAAGLSEADVRAWSATAPNYAARDFTDTWRSLTADDGIGPGTLAYISRQHGWRPDPNASPPRRLSAEELARQQAEREAKAAQAAAERQALADAAAADAVQRLANADPADPAHPYLMRKGIAPTPSLRQEGGALLVPVTLPDGTVRGLQLILADGAKRFSTGTRAAGDLWWARPPADEADPPLIVIVEGVADALTVAAAVTDAAAACAFSAGNLPAVAQALRERYPAADVVIAADADEAGRKGAAKAAAETGARVITPRFPTGASIDGKVPKDLDDLRQLAGIEAVRPQLMGLPDDADHADPPTPAAPLDPPPAPAADLPPAGSPADPPAHAAILDGTIPDCGAGSGYMVRDKGVYYLPPENGKGESPPERWLCDRLDVLATTHDSTGTEWGRLVAWRNPAGQLREWVIPAELLAGDGAEVRRELARGGLKMATGRGARELLAGYLMATTPRLQALSVSTTGWHRGAYVDRSMTVYGVPAGGARLVLAAAQSAPPPAATGTLEDWRQNVAWLAVGNSRLVISICAALAGPLLDLLGLEGGGLHLRGASSTGKSTALLAGASVVGDPADVMRSWRATAAGLEGVAAQHNDGTLFLDEIGEADPRQIGETAYMLANGRGRQRASAAGSARPVTTWRLLLVSSGELSLTAHMAAAGRRPAAGQELRLADIPADAGAGWGLFEQLHGRPTARALADALRDAVAHQHGTAWPAWLDWLARHRAAITDPARQTLGQFVAKVTAGASSAQAGRLARRFGALAVAGELATRAGITGWQAGEAIRAAHTCFADWLADYGDGPAEERALLEGVREFIERHGASRFRDFGVAGHHVTNAAGYYRMQDGHRVYLLHRTGLAEACRGAEPRWAVRVLRERGWLIPGKDGRPTHHLRPEGMSDMRLYLIDPAKWADGD